PPAWTRRPNSEASRDLPMPGSPATVTKRGLRSLTASSKAAISAASSRSRPTSGVVGIPVAASTGPTASQASTRSALPRSSRAPDGALGVVAVGCRRSEDDHGRVADELLDGAAVHLGLAAHGLEDAVERLLDVLGVGLVAERGRPDHVDEHDRHQLPLLHRPN